MNSAIEVRGLQKSYGGRAVLKGLDFDIIKGEIFALIGVNGAGKTTALECIEGLRRCDEGRITINGTMGIQLQDAALPAHIKPMEAVRLFAKWNRTAADDALLAALGVRELGNRQYAALSTGQKRRLHLALALISDPDIVFLDEPTAGLDVEGRASLHGQIRRLKAAGKTIVLTSHDMAEVETLCDRIAVLDGGELIFLGSTAELAEKMGKRCIVEVKTEEGTEQFETDRVGDALLELLEDLKRRGLEVLDIKISRGTLEQHLLEMTGRNKE